MVGAPKKTATLTDYLAIPEEDRHHEILDGELVQKTQPTARHGNAQLKLGVALDPFNRRGGGPPERPGGWWIFAEVDILLDGAPLRPDVTGWRRDRVPELTDDLFVRAPPDWICEVLSTSNPTRDRVRKKRIYHRHRIAHYWIVDPAETTLTVYRWQSEGYLELVIAERSDVVRAEPFDAIEIRVGTLFGDD